MVHYISMCIVKFYLKKPGFIPGFFFLFIYYINERKKRIVDSKLSKTNFNNVSR